MEEQESEVTVRPARPADRAAVLAFCVDTFSWGDDIPEVWYQWLADPNGQLLIAEVSGVPVGLQHVAFLTPGEGWLQGLRVDPAVRRRWGGERPLGSRPGGRRAAGRDGGATLHGL